MIFHKNHPWIAAKNSILWTCPTLQSSLELAVEDGKYVLTSTLLDGKCEYCSIEFTLNVKCSSVQTLNNVTSNDFIPTEQQHLVYPVGFHDRNEYGAYDDEPPEKKYLFYK